MPQSTTNQPAGPPRRELFVVSGSHFDLGWCADPAECLAYSDSIIRVAIDAITSDHPDYRFTVEYALFMEHFLKRYPAYESITKQLVRERKLEICVTAAGAMEQILDGELLIRAIVEGSRFVTETFGVRPLTAQHTDLPGHASQMPQILSLAGVKYVTGSRFHPGAVLFRRVAPDGSSVIFCNHAHHYKWGFVLRRGVQHALEHLPAQIEEIEPYSPVPQMLMAEEHDLEMPDLSIMDVIRELNSRDLPYKLRPATVTEFFESIGSTVDLPSYTGEAPYGFYTAPAFEPDIYLKSRAAENCLATAEKLSSMRHLHGLSAYPAEELRSGWKALFYPQDHNFAGRHGADNEEQRLNKAIHAHDIGKTLVHEAKLDIAVNIRHRREGTPVTVFNPCSWPRADLIQTECISRNLMDKGVIVRDHQDREIPCQVLDIDRAPDGRYDFQSSERSRIRFIFVAEQIPPLGYTTYYAESCPEPRVYESSLRTSPHELANSQFALRFGKSGLESIVRASDGRELADTTRYCFAEPVVLEDLRGDLEDAIEEQREKQLWRDLSDHMLVEKETLTGREWRAAAFPLRLDVTEAGPVRSTIRLTGRALDSDFHQTFSIYHALERIDLVTVIDWQGTQNTLVTLPMAFALDNPQITYESPFTAIRLDEDEFEGSYRGIGGREVQKWIDISGEGGGVTIATASGSHFLRGNSITPIVLKSSYSTGEPWHLMTNKGTWEFAHRIVPHAGTWSESKSYRHGWEHAAPVIEAHYHKPLREVPDSKQLPESGSLIQLDADNVVVTTIKRSDYSNGFIIRLFDAKGTGAHDAKLEFSIPPKSVKKVNLLEEPIHDIDLTGDTIHFALRPWEIATLLADY